MKFCCCLGGFVQNDYHDTGYSYGNFHRDFQTNPCAKEWDVPSLPLEDLVSYTDLDPAVAKGQSFMDSGEAASANLLESGYEMIRVPFETS